MGWKKSLEMHGFTHYQLLHPITRTFHNSQSIVNGKKIIMIHFEMGTMLRVGLVLPLQECISGGFGRRPQYPLNGAEFKKTILTKVKKHSFAYLLLPKIHFFNIHFKFICTECKNLSDWFELIFYAVTVDMMPSLFLKWFAYFSG